ncbi:MAG: hypothetical protein WKG07_26470 [Hymenobacter sp.]
MEPTAGGHYAAARARRHLAGAEPLAAPPPAPDVALKRPAPYPAHGGAAASRCSAVALALAQDTRLPEWTPRNTGRTAGWHQVCGQAARCTALRVRLGDPARPRAPGGAGADRPAPPG